jgi:hypothetical protein
MSERPSYFDHPDDEEQAPDEGLSFLRRRLMMDDRAGEPEQVDNGDQEMDQSLSFLQRRLSINDTIQFEQPDDEDATADEDLTPFQRRLMAEERPAPTPPAAPEPPDNYLDFLQQRLIAEERPALPAAPEPQNEPFHFFQPPLEERPALPAPPHEGSYSFFQPPPEERSMALMPPAAPLPLEQRPTALQRHALPHDAQLQLDQLDAWARAMEEGRGLLQEARTLHSEAEAARIARRWDEAADKFRQARTIYAAALTRLDVPATIDKTSYRALNALRDDAQKLLKQARDAVREHDQIRWAEMCERNMTMALDFLQQARVAMEEQNFAAARLLASQAGDMDPTLQAEAERTIRATGEIEAEEQQRATKRWIVVATVVVVLILALVIGGTQLWQLVARIFS